MFDKYDAIMNVVHQNTTIQQKINLVIMKGNDISVIPSLTIPFIQFNRSLSFYFVSTHFRIVSTLSP